MNAGSDFWSRRKARVRAETEGQDRAEAEADAARDVAALEQEDDETILTRLELPDPDSLSKGDDFSVFMVRAVPERIRRRALRKLWTSNPVLACVDGLNDYDDDYTAATSALSGPLKTAYKVGQGLLRDPQEAPEGATPAETTPAKTALQEPEAEQIADPVDTPEPTPPESQQTAAAPPETSEPPQQRPARRMRFAFADQTDRG